MFNDDERKVIEKAMEAFDIAMASDNPEVKKLLREFMMMVFLMEGTEVPEKGVFSGMQKRLERLERDQIQINRDINRRNHQYENDRYYDITGARPHGDPFAEPLRRKLGNEKGGLL